MRMPKQTFSFMVARLKGINCLTVGAAIVVLIGEGLGYAQSGDQGLERFRETYKELVETNSTLSTGN